MTAPAAERRDRHTPASAREVLESQARTIGDGGEWADLALAAGALLWCESPPPGGLEEPARALVEFVLDDSRDGLYAGVPFRGVPFSALALARIAGPDLYDRVAARLAAERGPIARDELALLSGWDAAGHALLAGLADEHRFSAGAEPAPPPDRWQRLAGYGYADFARSALKAADARVAAIQAGEIPYRADRAFTKDEVAVLGRAARVALMNDEPWLPGLLDRLVRGVAVAPTGARTLPSQALLYELARAAQDFPTPELAATLREARAIARNKAVPKQLAKMLRKVDTALAERVDVALRLPAPGFAPGGVLRRDLGGHQAEIVVGDDVELRWRAADGRRLRGVPAAVRRDHGDELKELRELVKRVRAQLATVARALEGGFTVEAARPYRAWRAELAAHPLTGTLVGRLIWDVGGRAALPADGGAVLHGVDGRPLDGVDDDTPVRLWHPVHATAEEIRAWRDLLAERRIRQPFRQAWREIYRLTPAEEETGVYSNRFAGHIVRYRRLFALLRSRGWSSGLLGPWDGGDEDRAERVLAGGRWQARFFHAYLHDGEGGEELASTDQVRIARHRDGDWREVPLAEVPPAVFSEAMRDVDLFVSVTSVAADPDWIDRGEDRFAGYWRQAGFGELTASAETRRDALARILPRTKIADRCALDGRFLVVRGDLRTYKIHLGSANILMEPDDQYLCIVPGRSRVGTVFLPFEDDRLALILSKAFLLAADTAITDPSIMRQIRRG
ncbi:hypothetical protein Acsp04_26440 [Actinomadura sp. NBRC 104425]|uniref:DUF4132 domain-containing protein n=1 Tax=Actinomadura sp. NBRC 104425 TaxID=3032204 RepID=UPI0024A1B744|nr:DUF4132 domain-containing protein [Actinomadura sp. NBRC 104425]GLZ12409.1 hypothetical protein Acsp04_26440 [Actinomadura sp. NBRC 104425]